MSERLPQNEGGAEQKFESTSEFLAFLKERNNGRQMSMIVSRMNRMTAIKRIFHKFPSLQSDANLQEALADIRTQFIEDGQPWISELEKLVDKEIVSSPTLKDETSEQIYKKEE